MGCLSYRRRLARFRSETRWAAEIEEVSILYGSHPKDVLATHPIPASKDRGDPLEAVRRLTLSRSG